MSGNKQRTNSLSHTHTHTFSLSQFILLFLAHAHSYAHPPTHIHTRTCNLKLNSIRMQNNLSHKLFLSFSYELVMHILIHSLSLSVLHTHKHALATSHTHIGSLASTHALTRTCAKNSPILCRAFISLVYKSLRRTSLFKLSFLSQKFEEMEGDEKEKLLDCFAL